MAQPFYYADEYHQWYMAKKEDAVCPILRNPMHD
ncbi:hypothetical protein ACJJIX_17145 [Microbulbifer sp. VAAC004]|nr:hypothetical protein QT397_17005 [Microbulbifer sp. MKSA007]